jgi:hypothetical protein
VNIVPRLLPRLFNLDAVRRLMFRTISQTSIHYRDSWLSEGVAGDVHGGDRLPWVPQGEGDDNDNFRPLESVGWQAHVYGECKPQIQSLCTRIGLPLHGFPWTGRAAQASLTREALYVVRPDGYVGLADAQANAETLEAYLNARGVVVS